MSFYTLARTDLVVDVEGYTAPTPLGGAGLYTALSSPARICDTRPGNISGLNSAPDNQCNGPGNRGETLSAGGTINVQVTGGNAIPAGATAAVFNVTVANPLAPGFLTVFPQGGTRPLASNVNFLSGQVAANRVIVPLSTTGATPGAISIYSSQAADVIVDVSGYYSALNGTGTEFTAESAPVRICDTRASSPANQCTGETIAPNHSMTLHAAGLAGVPTGATAVVVNLTGVTPTQPTFLTVFPGPTLPTASDLNPVAGEIRANMTVATLNANGTISIFNHSGSIDVVVDVLGWYS